MKQILDQVESEIKNKEELAYFLIHEARYKKILAMLGNVKGQKILDVGCYPYHMGRALELMGADVWGISSSHEPVKNKHVAVVNIETDRFPYKDNFFDIVLCSEVIEHLPHSSVPALKEMYRVTKRGGHIMLTTPNIARSINRGKLLLGKSPMYPVSAYLENQGKGSNLYHRHNREFTIDELKHLAESAGWTVESATHFISYTPFRRKNRKDNPLLWTGKFANFVAMVVIPRLRDTLLVVGRK